MRTAPNPTKNATDRVTFIEYYSKYLAKAASLLAANAPASAMRLFDREHQNIHEVVRWASQGPPPEALPFYSDILWDSMPLLSGRLDLLQREVFCKVCLTASQCTWSTLWSSARSVSLRHGVLGLHCSLLQGLSRCVMVYLVYAVVFCKVCLTAS